MDGLTFRPLVPTDAPALLAIAQAAEQAEPADSHFDLTEVEEGLSLPGVDLPAGSVGAVLGDSIVGAAYLQVTPPSTTWNAHLSGGVLPDFRRRGIGRAMLGIMQEKAMLLRDAEHPELPGDLQTFVPDRRVTAASFVASAGFATRRYFFDMRADLTKTQEAPQGDLHGIEIRAWSAADDDSTRLAYNAAFADHWGSSPMDATRWRTSFAESAFFRPEFSRLAVLGNEVVGFVLVAEFPAKTEANGYRTGYIDRVGSIRSVRGRGVAAALLTDAMDALAQSGCRYAELGVDADSPTGAGRLYERLGYTVQHTNQVVGLDF